MKLYFLAAFAILFSAPLFGQEKNPVLNCWIEGMGSDFDFYGEMDKLEDLLVDKEIISGDSGKEYVVLLEKIRSEASPKELEVIGEMSFQYVSEKFFRSCIAPIDLLQQKGKTLKYGMLFSIYLIGAQHEHASIQLEVRGNQRLLLEGKEISLEDFEKQTLVVRDAMVKSGIEKEEIAIALKVHSETKMGIIIDLQTAMRNMNIRRVRYSSLD